MTRSPLLWLRRLISGAVATAITAAAAPTESARAAAWSTRAPLPEARQEVAVASLNGRVYVIGGFRADVSISAAVDVYDPTTNAWSAAALLPTPIHHAAAASAGGKLYVFGGWPDFFVTVSPWYGSDFENSFQFQIDQQVSFVPTVDD